MGFRKNSTGRQADRSILAGANDRTVDGAGVGDHGRLSGGTETARRLSGMRSGERTLPPVTMSMRAAVRMDAPLALNRSFRIVSGLTPPTATAMCVSETPFASIQSLSSMGLSPTPTTKVPAELAPGRLAEVLAVLVSEIVAVLPVADRGLALERVTNRLDGFGRLTGGSEAAGLLGAVGGVLMRMER